MTIITSLPPARTRAFALAVALGTLPVLSQTAVTDIALQIPGRDLRENPPKVSALTIAPMGASGTRERGLLKVRFAEAGLPATLKFMHEGAVRILRDDGNHGDQAARDGVYSVLLDYDLGEIADFQNDLRASGQASTLQSMAAASQNEMTLSPLTASTNLDQEKTLFIRNLSVVNNAVRTHDPCLSTNKADSAKKWTFGYIMTQIANQPVTKKSPSQVMMSLLRKWENDQVVNTFTIPARPAIRQVVIDPWLRASNNTRGMLAMNKAPFRLLGIVNRVDLRKNLFFGEGLAGEMRFVWGVLDLENRAADGTCLENSSFTFIMEFAVDKTTQAQVKAWGQKWVRLNTLTLNSAAYRDSLQKITESVVRAGVGAPFNRANGSALIRIRTNEIALSSPWELREFVLAKAPRADSGLFFQTNVKQTPANIHNGTTLFRDFVNNNEAAILADRHNMPTVFQNRRFLGGSSFNNIDFWSAPGIRNNRARHLASLNTCNGCHGAETNTFSFLQVFPRPRNQVSNLAEFMTGVDVTDPVDGVTVRHFNDLDRRAIDLNSLVTSPTLSALSFQPMGRTH